ncbi:MAG: hypothetical protein KME20_20355 [Kaiparowitsia implicata GSE-PSE-MK54-09C]|nr:hypothetical protein [Kaiparowitsia implicata GSE-PSE-MK54-09C]
MQGKPSAPNPARLWMSASRGAIAPFSIIPTPETEGTAPSTGLQLRD